MTNICTYVTGPEKTGLIALFCISRNTNFNIECAVLLWWLDTVTPDILYNKCSYFYKLLECCWFFGWFFSVPVISRIESIWGGRAGGGWGEGGKPKAG